MKEHLFISLSDHELELSLQHVSVLLDILISPKCHNYFLVDETKQSTPYIGL